MPMSATIEKVILKSAPKNVINQVRYFAESVLFSGYEYTVDMHDTQRAQYWNRIRLDEEQSSAEVRAW